jgi:sugar-specific transcriptional regulator TrmB
LQDIFYFDKLTAFGFKESEAKVFLVLLRGGTMNASEIAGKAKITRPAVYDILKSFARKGFCNEIETNSIMFYEMIDPVIIADKIEKEITESGKIRLKLLNECFNELGPLYRSESDGRKNHINVELIRGFNRHRETKFYELFKNAKKEVFFMIRLEGFISEEIDETAKDFVKKGGVIRSIYEASSSFKIKVKDQWITGTADDLIKICKSYRSYGEDVRLSRSQLINMTIFDRETVFTNVNDKTVPRHNKSDIIVRNKDYAKNMIDLFEHYWSEAYTLDEFGNVKNKKAFEKQNTSRKVF